MEGLAFKPLCVLLGRVSRTLPSADIARLPPEPGREEVSSIAQVCPLSFERYITS